MSNITLKKVPVSGPNEAQEELAAAFPEVAFTLEPGGLNRLEGTFAKKDRNIYRGRVEVTHDGRPDSFLTAVSLYVSVQYETPEQARAVAEFLKQQLEAMMPGLKVARFGTGNEPAASTED